MLYLEAFPLLNVYRLDNNVEFLPVFNTNGTPNKMHWRQWITDPDDITTFLTRILKTLTFEFSYIRNRREKTRLSKFRALNFYIENKENNLEKTNLAKNVLVYL